MSRRRRSGPDLCLLVHTSRILTSANVNSRDRSTFSKTMLKRYIKDCVHREAVAGAPWLVKAKLAREYGLPTEQSVEVKARNNARNAPAVKRKEVGVPISRSPELSLKSNIDEG